MRHGGYLDKPVWYWANLQESVHNWNYSIDEPEEPIGPVPPCPVKDCVLNQDHSEPHFIWKRCSTLGCFLAERHQGDHIVVEWPTSVQEILESAQAHAKHTEEIYAALNNSVLDSMGGASRLATTTGPALASTDSIRHEKVEAECREKPSPSECAEKVTLGRRFAQHRELVGPTSKKSIPEVEASSFPEPLDTGAVDPHTDGGTRSSGLYSALDFSVQQIRLFELHPNSSISEVRGTFHCVGLSSVPVYIALSYMWGEEDDMRPVCIDGDRTMSVRGNLWHFLRLQSARISQPTLFWIDAICIDQSNVSERNHQVGLMKSIYTMASHVNIWLGQERDDSDLAIKFLTRTAKRGLKPALHGFRQIWNRKIGQAMLDLYERPYWRRMWIIQEIIHAENLTVWCGKGSFEWEAAESLYLSLKTLEDTAWFAHHPYAIQVLQSPASIMMWQRAHWRHPDTPAPGLRTLIKIFRDWQCGDLRDKVYALVGMADPESCVVPDYSRSARQVYYDVLKNDKNGDPHFYMMLSQILGIPGKEAGLPGQDL